MVLVLLNDAKAVAIVNGDGEKIFHKWPSLEFSLKLVLTNQTMCKHRNQGCGFCFSIIPVWLLPQPGPKALVIRSSERQAIHMNISPYRTKWCVCGVWQADIFPDRIGRQRMAGCAQEERWTWLLLSMGTVVDTAVVTRRESSPG